MAFMIETTWAIANVNNVQSQGHAVSFFKDADKTLTYGRLIFFYDLTCCAVVNISFPEVLRTK